MNPFRTRLRTAIENSDEYRLNIWKLSEDAGLGRKTIYNIVNDEKIDISNTGPGTFGMARTARLLGVSLDYLVGQRDNPTEIDNTDVALATHAVQAIADQSVQDVNAVSSDRLLRLHKKSGGRIEAFDAHIELCDIYYRPRPKDRHPRVKRVGKQSLSALTMGSPSQQLLQAAFENLDDDQILNETMTDYRNAFSLGAVTTIVSRDLPMPGQPIWVKMDILRTLLAVKDADGEESLMLFSTLII